MGRAAHYLVGYAERIHNVEREQRDMRCLEHVAAGVENEIRRLRSVVLRALGALAPLPQPLQRRVIELDARQLHDFARHFAETVDAVLALDPWIRLARHFHPGYVQQKARIDSIIAGLDAFAGQDAGIGPFARGVVAVAGADDVDDAADDRGRIFQVFGAKSAGAGNRADFDALAATRARIRHCLRTGV